MLTRAESARKFGVKEIRQPMQGPRIWLAGGEAAGVASRRGVVPNAP